MDRILNNFNVNFWALIGLCFAIALSTGKFLGGGGLIWGTIMVLLIIGLSPMIKRLRNLPRDV